MNQPPLGPPPFNQPPMGHSPIQLKMTVPPPRVIQLSLTKIRPILTQNIFLLHSENSRRKGATFQPGNRIEIPEQTISVGFGWEGIESFNLDAL